MKQLILFSLFLTPSVIANGQVVKIQNGIGLSRLNWELNDFGNSGYDDYVVGYAGFFGVEYLSKKYFNLSTSVGYIQKGGRETTSLRPVDPSDPNAPTGEQRNTARLNYFSWNTTVDLKYAIYEKWIPYMSLGPRVDILSSTNKALDGVKEIDALNEISYGLITGIGIKRDFTKVQIGVQASYNVNLNQLAEWDASSINVGGKISDDTLTTLLFLSYKLK